MAMRWLAAEALAVAVVGLADPAAPAQDLPEIKARGTLRAIIYVHARPEIFDLGTQGEPGFERELIEQYARLHRLQLEIMKVPSVGDCLTALQAGKGDVVVGGLGTTPARRKLVDFTTGVLPGRHVVVTRPPQRPVASIEELRALRVATMRGSSRLDEVVAAGVPTQNTLVFDTPEQVLAAVREGRASATVLSVSWAIIEQKRDPQLEMGIFIGPFLEQAWAVRRDVPALRASLDEFLANVRRTATWSRLVVKYFGDRALEALNKARGVAP